VSVCSEKGEGDRGNVVMIVNDNHTSRSTLCGRVTGLLLLLTNNLMKPRHEMLVEDQRLVENTIQALGPVAAQSRFKQFQQVYHSCQELTLKARVVMERNTISSLVSGAGCLEPVVEFASHLGEPGAESNSQVTPTDGLALGSAPGLDRYREGPESLLPEPLENAILPPDVGPSSTDFSTPDAALFGWDA
jgi:hypothetical protein